MIGPVDASVYKINDIYRKILYLKHENYDILIKIRNQMDWFQQEKRNCLKGLWYSMTFHEQCKSGIKIFSLCPHIRKYLNDTFIGRSPSPNGSALDVRWCTATPAPQIN